MRVEQHVGSKAARPLDLLAEHHRALDQQLDRLVMRAQEGDAELRAEWTAFERGLLRHLEQEETEILPVFARHDAAEARAILAEHAQIRQALLEMGLSLDLHCLRAEAVQEFVSQLKAHARREDGAFYAWAGANVAHSTWHSIKRSLKDAAHAGRRFGRLRDRIM